MAYPDLAPTTPWRGVNPTNTRIAISPNSTATTPLLQATLLRRQDAGNGFSVGVRNLGPSAFSFSVKQSNDAGVADAWAALTLRTGTTTATSIALQPGGYAEVEIDYASNYKQYVGIFTDVNTAVGQLDLIYNNGTFDQVGAPATTVTDYAEGLQPFDSGAVTITGDAALHLVYRIQALGRPVRLQGTVGAVALSSLKITDTPFMGGPESTLAQDTDFATATNPGVAYSRPTTPQTTAANGKFDILLTAGSAEYVIYAQSAGAATSLRITGTVLNNRGIF